MTVPEPGLQAVQTAGEAVNATATRLAAAGVPTPHVDAQLLVLWATGWSRTRLALDGTAHLPAAAAGALEAATARRERREPLQLILESVGFRYLEVAVEPGVFIPRPETEVLVEAAVMRVRPGGVVVEPCTGTGAVACAVAQEVHDVTVLATDVSPPAVDLARRNAQHNNVEVTVMLGDLMAPLPRDLRGTVDVVVSNPPYLASDELRACAPEVADWDPPLALVAGPTGHEVTDRLLTEAAVWLRRGGWVLLEVDASRAREVARRAAALGFSDGAVLQDLTGADRIVVARR